MIDRMGRKRALLGLTVMAVGALTILAPASALAQTVPDLSDPIGSTTDPVTGGGGGTTDTVTQPVKDTTDTVTQPVKDTTDTVTQPVKDTVDDTTKTVDNSTGGAITDTRKTVDDTTKSTTDSVDGTVGGAKDTTGSLSGSVLNPDLKVKNPLVKDKDGDGKVSNKERLVAAQERKDALKAAAAMERSEKAAGQAKDRSLAALERNKRVQGVAPVSAIAPPPRETFLTQLADAAVEATKKLAFPLGLALMVGAFLMVQGRIDRKDAKLALAPIDSEQDLLSFQ